MAVFKDSMVADNGAGDALLRKLDVHNKTTPVNKLCTIARLESKGKKHTPQSLPRGSPPTRSDGNLALIWPVAISLLLAEP